MYKLRSDFIEKSSGATAESKIRKSIIYISIYQNTKKNTFRGSGINIVQNEETTFKPDDDNKLQVKSYLNCLYLIGCFVDLTADDDILIGQLIY